MSTIYAYTFTQTREKNARLFTNCELKWVNGNQYTGLYNGLASTMDWSLSSKRCTDVYTALKKARLPQQRKVQTERDFNLDSLRGL